MQLISIDLRNLRNNEYLQWSKNVITTINGIGENNLLVTEPFGIFKTVTAVIDDLFKTSQGSPITATIEALDARRDSALTGIATVINGFTYHYDDAIKEHAKKLAANLSLYGTNITRDNYQGETATITGIVNDWGSKQDLADAIDALGLKLWCDTLSSLNASFDNNYMQRNQVDGALNPDTIKERRAESIMAWYGLRDYIESYYVIKKGEAPFKRAVNELNALITRYNTIINERAATAPETPTQP